MQRKYAWGTHCKVEGYLRALVLVPGVEALLFIGVELVGQGRGCHGRVEKTKRSK